jgi:capsular exopolysaccharide synthesis family protein
MSNVEFNRGRAVTSPDVPADVRALDRAPMSSTPPQITQILSIARRRKWLVASAVAGALLIGLLITLLMTPQYTATSIVDIQREGSNFIEVNDAQTKGGFSDQEFYETQYGLLKARSLAEHVATSLRLFDDAHFFDLLGTSRNREWFENGRPKPNASSRETRIAAAAAILLDNIDIVPERRSRLINIRFTSPDPNLSKQVVDAWARSFIQVTLDRRVEATSYARRFLEERLGQLRARIDQSERVLVGYAAREGIVNVPGTPATAGQPGSGTPERPLVADDLVALNHELGEATAQRVQAQSRLGSRPGEVTEALDNQAIATMRQSRSEAAADYARMMVQFEPDYPPARALQGQIQQLDRAIAREEARVQSALRQTYTASQTRETALRHEVDNLKGGLLDLRRRSIQYNIYQREVDTNRQLYDALLQRYKEIGVAGGVGVNNISIVDVAETPEKPSSPRLLLNIALSLFVGLGLGAAAAFLLDQIDQGISDPTEVEAGLGIPLLGTIPKEEREDPIEALEDRKSSITEAYHSLQTGLSFSTDHGIPRTLAVTSTRPAEGKTTTAFALASSIARSKGKVLLIDADMRSPSLHHLFGLGNEAGLSNYLSGSGDAAGLIHQTRYEGLYVMTAGPQPPSAPELLSGERLKRLIAELGAQFGHVVFDVPPVMGLADAPLVGSVVEGVVFVVEANGTQKSMARVAIGRLRDASAQILGSVLTKFDSRRAYYGYGYDYGYGYGYGETAQKAS